MLVVGNGLGADVEKRLGAAVMAAAKGLGVVVLGCAKGLGVVFDAAANGLTAALPEVVKGDGVFPPPREPAA